MNEQFWQDFYSKPHTQDPSPFAQWCNIGQGRVVDFGCGNGRDSQFIGNNATVIGVDLCAPEEQSPYYGAPTFVRSSIEDFLATNTEGSVAYCRFLLHAVEPDVQEDIFQWAIKNRAALYLEFRTDKDKPKPDHKRRLINGNHLMLHLMTLGFSIARYEEGYGLAPFNGEDPHIARIVTEPWQAPAYLPLEISQ
jgi:SAM-dependent methyltransferase